MDHEEYHLIENAFIEGFRKASDRLGFLRLAGIPMELDGPDLPNELKLLEVKIEEKFSVGTAAPGFGSDELVYHPLPGEMIKAQNQLSFVYISARDSVELSLADIFARRDGVEVAHSHDHSHHHHHHH